MTPSPLLPAKTPVSVVVLTFNEARNLPALLASVSGWAADVFVVDSGSTDATAAIAAEAGAQVVVHPFETHARQWRWALDNLAIRTDWVLALDADQSVMPECREAIARLVTGPSDAKGAFVRRRQIFRGRWIRHGGYYPKHLLKLFRLDSVSLDDADLVDHHFAVNGRVVTLDADIIEDNRNEAEIGAWVAKHNRYARLQAIQESQVRPAAGLEPLAALRSSPDSRVRLQKQAWARMPPFVRPCLYFLYRYVLRLGFLDGKEGFIFHVLQAFWYRLLVDINVDELRAGSSSRLDAGAGATTNGMQTRRPSVSPRT